MRLCGENSLLLWLLLVRSAMSSTQGGTPRMKALAVAAAGALALAGYGIFREGRHKPADDEDEKPSVKKTDDVSHSVCGDTAKVVSAHDRRQDLETERHGAKDALQPSSIDDYRRRVIKDYPKDGKDGDGCRDVEPKRRN